MQGEQKANSLSSRTKAEKNAHQEKIAEILSRVGAIPRLAASVVPASRLDVRPSPEMVSSGIPQLDSLTGGLPRGCLTEICGTASSGRTGILLVALAHATQRGEVCALVDAGDAFDPASATAAGMEMTRLLWVRCGEKYPSQKHPWAMRRSSETPDDSNANTFADKSYIAPLHAPNLQGAHRKSSRWKNPETQRWESQLAQMLKVTDLLLQSNGFGMIALDLGDVPMQSARRIPLASWFRFRRAVERTPTVLLVLEQHPIAGSCSSVLLKVSGAMSQFALRKQTSTQSELAHSQLLDQFEITAELLHSRLERAPGRKPVQSTACFQSRATWAG